MKKGQKIKEKWDRVPLTDDEIQALINECVDIEQEFIITFMADSGCRVNELIRCRKKGWFDYDDDLLWLRKKKEEEVLHANVIKTKKRGAKTKEDRFVELTPRLKDVSIRFFKEYKSVNRSPAWVYCFVRDLSSKIDIDEDTHITPHVFRHSYIQKMYDESNLKSKEIGKLVGHCDGTMVENNYTHGENKDIINKLRRDRKESGDK